MGQFPALPTARYVFTYGSCRSTTRRFRISEIPGSKPACGSPRLIAACYALHRLPAPRHPPYALSSLTYNSYTTRAFLHVYIQPNNSVFKDRGTVRSTVPKFLANQFNRVSRGSPPQLAATRSALRPELVEVSGIEPLTPCLQSRCSPS